MPETSTTRAWNSCSHSTSPLSGPTWNMQSSSGHRIYVETLIKWKEYKERLQKWFPWSENHSYQQRLKDFKLISLVQKRLRGQLIEVFKYMNRFNNVSPIGLFDYDLNGRTRNNGKKLIVKRFNTSVAQHFFPINITTTWNVLPYDVVNSRTVNTFKNSLDAHWEDNPPDVQVNW